MPTLTITAGEGGTTVPTPGTHDYALNSLVQGITAEAYAGYTFVRWLLDGVEEYSNPITVLMDIDHTLEASFIGAPPPLEYTLTITATEGGTTNPSIGPHIYDENASVTVEAAAFEGYEFTSWLLDGVYRTENPITVTMNSNHTLQAVFAQTGVTPPAAVSLGYPEIGALALGAVDLVLISIAVAARAGWI